MAKRNLKSRSERNIDEIWNDAVDRSASIELLSDSIVFAHNHSPASWELSIHDNGIRLNVGQIAVMDLWIDSVAIYVIEEQLMDKNTLSHLFDSRHVSYSAIPHQTLRIACGYDTIEEVWPKLKDAHLALVEEAAARKKGSPFQRFHSTELVDWLAITLNREIPQPSYLKNRSKEPVEKHHRATPQLVDWKEDVIHWWRRGEIADKESEDTVIRFLEHAFECSSNPNRTWFGIHGSVASVVIGAVYLAALHRNDGSIWILLDQDPPLIDGIKYWPARSTIDSKYPLLWGHASSIQSLTQLVDNAAIWKCIESASRKVFFSSRASADRDELHKRRGKRRLSEFWIGSTCARLFPDEIVEGDAIVEGARRQVLVNAYERDPRARELCLIYHGRRCSVCGLAFDEVYGRIASGFIHVHHIRPLSEIGQEYQVNPITDLRPVCPNCHAVIHLRKPPFSIEEMIQIIKK